MSEEKNPPRAQIFRYFRIESRNKNNCGGGKNFSIFSYKKGRIQTKKLGALTSYCSCDEIFLINLKQEFLIWNGFWDGLFCHWWHALINDAFFFISESRVFSILSGNKFNYSNNLSILKYHHEFSHFNKENTDCKN